MPDGFVGLLNGPRNLVRPMFRSLAIAASGLSAQRQRMETIAANVANAETTHTEAGGPYKRQVVRMDAQHPDAQSFEAQMQGLHAFGVYPPMPPIPPETFPPPDPAVAGGVRVTGIDVDASEGPLVYEPGHPDANAQGYVRYPNVRITDEMIDLMDAKRVYEANATVFQSAKAMLRRAMDI